MTKLPDLPVLKNGVFHLVTQVPYGTVPTYLTVIDRFDDFTRLSIVLKKRQTSVLIQMETLIPEAVKNRETLADVKKRARLEDVPVTEALEEEDDDVGADDVEADDVPVSEDTEGDVAM